MPAARTHRLRLILAAVDFSRASAKALRYAVAAARAGGGRVVAVHAVDPLLSAAASRAYASRPLAAETRASLVKFVQAAVGAAVAPAVECVVSVGTARHVLIDECRRLHADIVVVGTNGRGGVAKAFFGSATEALLRRHLGAVMVIPPRCPDPSPEWPGPSVVAAVKHDRHRRSTMQAAAHAAEVFGAWLSVVDFDTATPPSAWRRAALVLLPMPAADRFRTFRQGTVAYRFVCAIRRPVLVMHSGRRIGHREVHGRAA